MKYTELLLDSKRQPLKEMLQEEFIEGKYNLSSTDIETICNYYWTEEKVERGILQLFPIDDNQATFFNPRNPPSITTKYYLALVDSFLLSIHTDPNKFIDCLYSETSDTLNKLGLGSTDCKWIIGDGLITDLSLIKHNKSYALNNWIDFDVNKNQVVACIKQVDKQSSCRLVFFLPDNKSISNKKVK